MAAAVARRLVPAALVPRAVSVIFSGITVATIVAVPLGSYLGELTGWRSTFLAAAALGVGTLGFQFFALPRVTPRGWARWGRSCDGRASGWASWECCWSTLGTTRCSPTSGPLRKTW
ncbi:MFS transporter [Streptomyces chrestomyceticus]